ncbi:alpha-E domain-containing protein, partial [Symmachiella dynata]
DTWRIIHGIDEDFRPAEHGTTTLSDLLAMTDELIAKFSAFSGVIMESMTRTQAFHFLELGRRLERSLQIISLVKNCFIPMPEFPGPIFGTVLEVADSLMTYRARYLANRQLAAVLDLVLTDETNPRALAFQFVQLVEHVEQLPRDQTSPDYAAEQRLAMSLLHSVRLMDIQAIAEVHALGDHEPLERLTAEWESQLPKLAEAISHRYLVHAAPSHQLADISPQ